MKRILAIFLALMLVLALALPASAITMDFDIGKAQGSIDNAISDIVQENQPEPEPECPGWSDYFDHWRDFMNHWFDWFW